MKRVTQSKAAAKKRLIGGNGSVAKKQPQASTNYQKLSEEFIIRYLEFPVLIFDHRTHHFPFANEPFIKLLGYSLEELNNPNDGFFTLIHPKDLELWKTIMEPKLAEIGKQYKNKQVSFYTNSRIKSKQGNYLHFLIQTRVLEWAGDQRAVIFNIFIDISDYKKDASKLMQVKVLNEKDGTWDTVYKETFHFQPDMLSRKETEIMKLMTAGLSVHDICKSENMNYYTVRAHWRNVISKTGCSGLDQLKEKAHDEGWV